MGLDMYLYKKNYIWQGEWVKPEIKQEVIECNFDKVCEKLLKESLHKEASLDVKEQMNNF